MKSDSMSPFSRSVQWVSTTMKNLLFIGGCLLAGFTFLLGFKYYDKEDVDQKIAQSRQSIIDRGSKRFKRLKDDVAQNSKAIQGVKKTVGEIQSVQHKTFARDEAKRLTADIRERRRREKTYDWLVDRNLRRLRAGKDPCSTVNCD